MSIWRKGRLAWQLPLTEKLWFVIAFIFSGLFRISMFLFHFKKLSSFFGNHYGNTSLCAIVSEDDKLRAWRIGQMVELASRFTPWEAKCLSQAAMAKLLLRYYSIPYILHIGARISEDGVREVKAHAWVTVGAWTIVGGGGLQQFGIVSTFVPNELVDLDDE